MRTLILLALLLPLTGCITTPSVREYDYNLDLTNATDQPIALELLRGRTSSLNRMRVDLAPGGSFVDTYTVYGDAEYLEARMRPLAADDSAPWFITELPTGHTRANIVQTDTGLALTPRRPDPVPGVP